MQSSVAITRFSGSNEFLLGQVVNLQEEVFGNKRPARQVELQEAILRPEENVVFLAIAKGRVRGFVSATRSPRMGRWTIRGIGVHETFRGSGIGSALLRHMINHVNGSMNEILVSHVAKDNMASLRLHEKQGFQIDSDARACGTSMLTTRLVSLP